MQFSIQTLESSDYKFDFLIRGSKGEVIRGSSKWEKPHMTIYLFVVGSGGRLEVKMDGLYTSGGLGSYPKDEKFDKNLEPKYYQLLDEYTKSFVSDFKNYLLKN